MAIMYLNKVGKGRDRRLQSRRNCTPCDAWKHFAGGETSATTARNNTDDVSGRFFMRGYKLKVGFAGYPGIGDHVADIRHSGYVVHQSLETKAKT